MAERKARVLGLEQTVRRLKALPRELSGTKGGPIRKAAFEGAGVILREAKSRAPEANQVIERKFGDIQPGTLKRAIIRRRHPNPRKYDGRPRPTEVYRVGADNKKAWWWWWIEAGTAKMPAQPYLRTAAADKFDDALRIFSKHLKLAIDKIEAKLR